MMIDEQYTRKPRKKHWMISSYFQN